MDDKKPFWASLTLWGSLAGFLGIILPKFGIGVSPIDLGNLAGSFTTLLNDALTFGGLLLTVIGRIQASKTLTLTRAAAKS